MTKRISCKKCKNKVLPITVEKYDGLCKPCFDEIIFNSPEAIEEREKRLKESNEMWLTEIQLIEDISTKAIEKNQKIIFCPKCGEILEVDIAPSRVAGKRMVKNIICPKNNCVNIHFD